MSVESITEPSLSQVKAESPVITFAWGSQLVLGLSSPFSAGHTPENLKAKLGPIYSEVVSARYYAGEIPGNTEQKINLGGGRSLKVLPDRLIIKDNSSLTAKFKFHGLRSWVKFNHEDPEFTVCRQTLERCAGVTIALPVGKGVSLLLDFSQREDLKRPAGYSTSLYLRNLKSSDSPFKFQGLVANFNHQARLLGWSERLWVMPPELKDGELLAVWGKYESFSKAIAAYSVGMAACLTTFANLEPEKTECLRVDFPQDPGQAFTDEFRDLLLEVFCSKVKSTK